MNATKYATKEQVEGVWMYHHVHLDEYPSAGPNPNITGMKNKYWGKDAYCIKHGRYVYNVPKNVYNLF